MDLSRLFPKKSKENEGQSEKVKRMDAFRKPAQKPAKPRKVEGAAKKVAKKPEESKPALWVRQTREYLREVSYELRKVVWPSRKETIGSTIVVLVIVLLSAVFLGVADSILSRMVRLIVG